MSRTGESQTKIETEMIILGDGMQSNWHRKQSSILIGARSYENYRSQRQF